MTSSFVNCHPFKRKFLEFAHVYLLMGGIWCMLASSFFHPIILPKSRRRNPCYGEDAGQWVTTVVPVNWSRRDFLGHSLTSTTRSRFLFGVCLIVNMGRTVALAFLVALCAAVGRTDDEDFDPCKSGKTELFQVIIPFIGHFKNQFCGIFPMLDAAGNLYMCIWLKGCTKIELSTT